ncbi:hypothetical protein [Rhodococcus sp. B10]|uniref:hypothetical protein n=1 Tax=Rhodococcus sp. B10 TaxID=2695876 RepID=UPI00143156D3|nr:hypothetical protein [Rhodococcus sp. B10]NIL78402.1 hypothetical protein [Rhodococcus sp. B10]
MIGWIVVAVVCAAALLQAGATDTGWRFAPLRATGLVATWIFRIVVAVAGVAVALIVGVAAGAFRSNM